MVSNQAKGRKSLVGYLHRALFGPAGGSHEQIEGSPFLRYMMGILYGRGVTVDDAEGLVVAGADQEAASASNAREDERGADDWVPPSDEILPSVVGLSFVVPNNVSLRCRVRGANYESSAAGRVVPGSTRAPGSGRGGAGWRRVPLPADGFETATLTPQITQAQVLEGRALLTSRWRAKAGHSLVTVSLVNTQSGKGMDASAALFQVELECQVSEGSFLPYPVAASGESGDAEEARYLYRATTPYARGHGAAADWDFADGRCSCVRLAFLPQVEVPAATFALAPEHMGGTCGKVDSRVFSVQWLANGADHKQEALAALNSLVEAYGLWIVREADQASTRGERLGQELARRAEEWRRRMQAGLDCLSADPTAWRAFCDANWVMGTQMVLAAHLRQLSKQGRVVLPAEVSSGPALLVTREQQWRPFQVAFALGVIESLVNPTSGDRSCADVIWFPTGGGKTEAYLLVATFELLRRRLIYGDADTATAILSRYTLRMITAQQFERTATVFTALEILRRQAPKELGSRPFTLGLWVGGGDTGLTPNRLTEGATKLTEYKQNEGERKNPFLLRRCPRCGTELMPTVGGTDSDYGVVATEAEFRMFCPSAGCEFHDDLPVGLIDEALYTRPPSMVIGTIDKFAMLPWSEQAKPFFTGPDGRGRPPSLLIQDELHLISGPLGTLNAMYEAAIEDIIVFHGGERPKIVASTATIRNASEQVRGLYARRASVFPSPILAWDDAFFFRADRHRSGRLYVGVMGQGYIKPVIALVWTAAAVLQGAKEEELTPEERDAYWTLVAYHNSRRELGRTLTAARDEIPTRIKVLASADDAGRSIAQVMQLSAQGDMPIDEAIRRLEAPFGQGTQALDFVPCTSILSVGVDIDRLGLMLVNGQPKLTAEYIQATSRVGRGEVPGLVVTLFSSMKARDRSHYEDFRAYHDNLYRYVEPTSVTPLAPPALGRTLHAALIAAIRYETEWKRNDQAKDVLLDGPEVGRIVDGIVERAVRIDSAAGPEVKEALRQIISSWRDRQQHNLLFDKTRAGAAFEGLIRDYGGVPRAGFPTMRSMRHIDDEVQIRPYLPVVPR